MGLNQESGTVPAAPGRPGAHVLQPRALRFWGSGLDLRTCQGPESAGVGENTQGPSACPLRSPAGAGGLAVLPALHLPHTQPRR